MNKIQKLVKSVLGESYGKPFAIKDYVIVGMRNVCWRWVAPMKVENWIRDFILGSNDAFSVNIRITTEACTKYPDYHINEFLPNATNMRLSEIKATFGHLVEEDSAETLPAREELEKQHGQVWNTKELQQDFTVQGFASPCVLVIRKSDGVKGTLEFIHQPRFYFDFVEAG